MQLNKSYYEKLITPVYEQSIQGCIFQKHFAHFTYLVSVSKKVRLDAKT